MTQVGEGQEADEVAPAMTTPGAPTLGEILAERYELAEHINNDGAGRQVWRGVDVILRRPVAVVLRYPGGDPAMEMLQAAVAASRVIHPNLVGVYDAIDEGERAYVVREWVDGDSLREMVVDGPLDPARSTSIAHAIAGAVAAVHATGMLHGNVHPGTVLAGDDGRIVLADARADSADTPETDVRAIGGILYFALTGHWPHAEAPLANGSQPTGRPPLPDAVRDASGAIAAPRQVRAGVPAYLDDLTMDLLDGKLALPSSDVLAAELGRLDAAVEEEYLDVAGPLRFTSAPDGLGDQPRATRRKITAGIAGLLAIAAAGLFFGISALADSGDPTDAGTDTPATIATPGTSSDGGGETSPARNPEKITLEAGQVRVVDPDGTRTELDGVAAVVDGDANTGWDTESYDGRGDFGGLKRGMGILIDLRQPREVTSVQVVLSTPGASAELLAGPGDPGSSAAGDNQIIDTYSTRIGEPFAKHDGTTMTFSAFQPDQQHQYLLVWITELPGSGNGKFKIGVQEITVEAR
ncbi:hypothetical protein GCM10009779_18070 [Polymorphospora rubra]|uniref:Protein kinase domain-containing protein n=1 Tax=Polymorphospora rubra TaxID=338584 RepID=A0A810MY46_9ACTN|nr:hypothetical protein Prubr_25110 [Polymorphospora rubra]